MLDYKYALAIGDRWNDGHGKYQKFVFFTNYLASDIYAAYCDFAKEHNFSLTRNINVTRYYMIDYSRQTGIPLDIYTLIKDSLILLADLNERIVIELENDKYCAPGYINLGNIFDLPETVFLVYLSMARCMLPDLKIVWDKEDYINIDYGMGYGAFE